MSQTVPALAGMIAVLLAGAASCGSTRLESAGLVAVVESVVERTNDYRVEHSAPPVEVVEPLQDASRYFADYLAGSDVYSHTADGAEPAERAEAYGYEHCILTENIAYTYREAGFADEDALAKEIVQGWIDSPGHRRNMLDADVADIGVSIARSEHTGRYYAVQMFGRPRDQAIDFSIANDWNRSVSYELAGRTLTLVPGQVRQHRVCRPPEVELALPRRARQADRMLQPQAGDRFVIVARAGGAVPEVVRR